jgi:hypothetical protein
MAAAAGDEAGRPGDPLPGVKVTYTFDHVAITTTKITTDAGEAAARRAADGLVTISVRAAPGDLDVEGDVPDGVTYDPVCVSPRGRAYLVDAAGEDGREVAVSTAEFFSEPISGDSRGELARLLASWREAADGPSADAEHAAAEALADAVSGLLGSDPPAPAGRDPDGGAALPGPGQAARPEADSRRGNRAGSRRPLSREGTARRGRRGSR